MTAFPWARVVGDHSYIANASPTDHSYTLVFPVVHDRTVLQSAGWRLKNMEINEKGSLDSDWDSGVLCRVSGQT